ncbi:MAG: KEOPS complex subunit Cgi121 [Promethearchaeota archaeon]|jgi:tRNA threonylcarbamoyladenosine modification (KEOPS) complex Cgi121 subunit
MGDTFMIIKNFYVEELELNYFVGLNQITLDLNLILGTHEIKGKGNLFETLFSIIERIQKKNQDLVIQFIKDTYVLNQDHIFTACYYLQKAFHHKSNISNSKNIELLLYLSSKRQISKGMKSFGIDKQDLQKGKLTTCFISPINNIEQINKELLHELKANEVELTINDLSYEKINRINQYFDFNNVQIKSILNSYGIKYKDTLEQQHNLNDQSLAIFDLICEKMALLNIE